MKYPVRKYKIIHAEKIETGLGIVDIRVCAITDPEEHRLAFLNDKMPVRIERRVTGNTYEVIGEYKSIATAQEELPTHIQTIKDANQPPEAIPMFDF